MELKMFVKQVLIDVTEAVIEAKNESRGAIAVFRLFDGNEVLAKNEMASAIEFDIGVNVKNSNMFVVDGGAGVDFLPLKAEAKGKKERSEDKTHEHRIRFSVPVYFQALSTPPAK
jgi:hypothetical protein